MSPATGETTIRSEDRSAIKAALGSQVEVSSVSGKYYLSSSNLALDSGMYGCTCLLYRITP